MVSVGRASEKRKNSFFFPHGGNVRLLEGFEQRSDKSSLPVLETPSGHSVHIRWCVFLGGVRSGD